MNASPFAIDIEKLRDAKIELDVCEDPQALDLDDLPGMHFDEPIAGHLTYSMSGTDIFIRGRLKTVATAECVRCLEPAHRAIDAKISLNFLGKGADEDPSAFDEEIEDLDVDTYSGETLDPLPQIRDSILLEVPGLPLCRDDCKGLCPHCGANLNRETCNCAATLETEPHESLEDSWKMKLKGFNLE